MKIGMFTIKAAETLGTEGFMFFHRLRNRKLPSWAAVLLAAALALAGCAGAGGGGASGAGAPGMAAGGGAGGDGKLTVVATFFPLYDLAARIGGGRVSAVSLIPTGVEPHDWSPKSRDMMNIAEAGVFIYQGAGFEGWTEEVLAGLDTSKMVIVEASAGIELLSASEESHEHEHEHEHGHGHDHGDTDPHTWVSPRSALRMAENIFEGLIRADPEHEAAYRENYEKLREELAALDAAYTERLSAAVRREMVVSHRAFGYLARDYGLEQVSILGLSPDGEPTAQDLKEISRFVKERGVTTIFTERLSSAKLAETLARDLGVATAPLHPLEGLTKEEAAAGETYISLMYANLAQLAAALGAPEAGNAGSGAASGAAQSNGGKEGRTQ